MISRFFIDRPVFASVLSIVIILAGLAAMNTLPIAQYPNIIPPQVSVTTTYPGASAETIANTVAAPLEQQINGVSGMIYMYSSNSSSGQYTLTVTFAIGTDPDMATAEVNNRVQTALATLPDPVQRQGIAVNKQSSSILEVITLFSPDGRYDPVFINNYGLVNIIGDLQRIPGVGAANFFASINYSMRIWLDPDKLLQYNLTASDISNAVQEQNAQFTPGKFGQDPMEDPQPFTYTAITTGRLSDPKEFENIILRAEPDGSTLKLKDVARVELGAQNYNVAANYNGNPSVAIGVYLAPGANALATTAAVAQKMAELSKNFPAGIKYEIPFNTTEFVKISIDEVIKTLFEAILLVGIVVYLFLQSVRASLIPLIAVPIALIGTFAGVYILGFSINLLTLFAMVLAIGIVVDDAIVVLENFERILRTENLTPREAILKAMEEVTGPVIAIVLVLCAVFIPVGFMGGLTGQMYKQFAVTIAVSVTISGFVALTLTPTLCVLFIKKTHEKPLFFLEKFNQLFEKITTVYMKGVNFILSRAFAAILAFLGIIALMAFLFIKIPTSLVPDEDQGYVFVIPVLLPGASLQRTKSVNEEILKKLQAEPTVKGIITVAGYDFLSSAPTTNTSVSFVMLKDWSKRKKPQENALFLTQKFMKMFQSIQDGIVLAFNPPAITGISTTGGFEMYLQSRKGENVKKIQAQAEKLLKVASRRPELSGVRTTISANVPQLFIELDRTKAKALDVSVDDVFNTMKSTTGNNFVNNFTYWGRTFQVTLQSDAPFREKPENLKNTFVRAHNGSMISLDTLVRVERVLGADLVLCFNIFPSAKFLGGAAPGYSSGQALAAMEEVAAETLSKEDYTIGWTGPAYQEKEASGKGNLAFVFGIIMTFLILAAQYERWSLPIAVITAVPFSVCGALLALWLRGLNNDVYFQIGLVTLIGLSAKNAILMIEFASQQHRAGKSIIESALEAAHLRFRPIVMTSLAFILGCVPLAISTGAGSAARHSIGTGVIGGMLASTLISTLFVPLFFKLVMQLSGGEVSTPQQSISHE